LPDIVNTHRDARRAPPGSKSWWWRHWMFIRIIVSVWVCGKAKQTHGEKRNFISKTLDGGITDE